MLHTTYFERELELTYNDTHYEVIRPLGHPMVFFHGETGAPIAALHFVSGDCRTFISERHVPGPTASFLGVIEEDKRAVAIVLTNLLFGSERLLINVSHGSSGDGPSLNDVNCIEAGTSVKVEGDYSRGNQKLVLDSLAIAAGQTVADSVVQDEARVQGPKGTYLTIAIYPQKGSNYRSGTWKCVDLFARQLPAVTQTQGGWYGERPRRRALEGANDFYQPPRSGGIGYDGPGFGFGDIAQPSAATMMFGPSDSSNGGNIGRAAVIENRRIPAGIPFIGGGGSWGSGASVPRPVATAALSRGFGALSTPPAPIPTAAFSFGITQLSPSSSSNGGWGSAAAAEVAAHVASVGQPRQGGFGGGFGSGFGAAASVAPPSPPAFTPTSPPRGESDSFSPPSPGYSAPSSPSFGGGAVRDEYDLAEFAAVDNFSAQNTRAATLRSDTERVHVDSREITDDIFDTTAGARLATLCLSVIAVGSVEMLPQLSKADALHRCMEMAHDTIVNGNKRLLASLERGIHVSSEECVICMSARSSVVFITCGHQCACGACTNGLTKVECPMCRASIQAKIHV